MLLTSLLIIPLLGITIISTKNTHKPWALNAKHIKTVALSASLINLYISLIIFILFDFSQNQFQFVENFSYQSSLDFYLGVDGVSIYFILLTTIITPIALLSN
jgi:NADH:ubiquinone oxidoreductase subunit 4 (subunit M)